MISILNNDELLQYITNVVDTVEGETPLFDKILPQLEITEQWLHDTIVGDIPIDGERGKMVATVIACEAFRRAVPSLDLILTPNGFGVVSNSNVAPASKERVERLIASLAEQRDKALGALFNDLRKDDAWIGSAQGKWLASSFFSSYENDPIPQNCMESGDRWQGWLQLRQKAVSIEQAYSEKGLGQAVTARLRLALAKTPNGTADEIALAESVRSTILEEVCSGRRLVYRLDRCVNYIRDNAELYPEWQSDPVAELFEDKWRFKNEKKSPGYFF